jgi:hypothetical protein
VIVSSYSVSSSSSLATYGSATGSTGGSPGSTTAGSSMFIISGSSGAWPNALEACVNSSDSTESDQTTDAQ